ncbi:MAG: DUF4340 domain-containing protein [Candidatus Binataceae bacterium]
MSARPAILFTLLFVILTPFYLLADRPQVRKGAELEHERASLLDLSAIDAITLTHGNEVVRFEKTADGKLYKIVTPPNGFAPQDLMRAMAALLIEAREVEVVADNSSNLKQFGLDHPAVELTIEAPGRKEPVRLIFGAENPTRTAIYAKISTSPKVFLLGRNIEYYQELMFQWVEGKQGKKA